MPLKLSLKSVCRMCLGFAVASMPMLSFAADEAYNPVASPISMVESGNMRFTVLTPEMIRIEWRSSADYDFTDNASFTILNRYLPVPGFNEYTKNGFLHIDTDKLKLRYRIGSNPVTDPPSPDNLSITLEVDGKPVTWYPGLVDDQNLKGTCRTLDQAVGDNKRAELEDGLISRSGWAVIDETGVRGDGSRSLLLEPRDGVEFDWVTTRPDKDGIDWYFMGYGHDYKKALYDFTQVAGKIPLPPLYAFGYWYSKFQRYTDNDFKEIVNEIKENNIPIDVMVIDTDWHINDWTGWSWNRELFPEPEKFLDWLHDHDLKITLNLHPAYGVAHNEDHFKEFLADLGKPEETTWVEWNLENPDFYHSFFKNILRPHEEAGVDFWWLDWQQWVLSNKVEGLGHTFWLNYVFFNDMATQHPERRAMIFHRWGGLGNHRYQLGFSGDTTSDFPTLAFEPYFTATASNVGYGYWGHDLGGHMQWGPNDPELYLRWIQYGVFSPLFRTHSSNMDYIERRIWKYPNFPLLKDAVLQRYALIPYIYTQARNAYDTGIGLCRPLYYEYPEADEAYQREGEYMFGDDILANPITKGIERPDSLVVWDTWLPEGEWYDVMRNNVVKGNTVLTDLYTLAETPHFYRAGAIIPNYPPMDNLKTRPECLILKFAPGADGSTSFYEDANDTEAYKDGEYARTSISQHRTDRTTDIKIDAIEGSFDGMPSQRAYVLEVLRSLPPTSVTVNGQLINKSSSRANLPGSSSWSYDPASRCLTIEIPTLPTSEAINVKVNH